MDFFKRILRDHAGEEAGSDAWENDQMQRLERTMDHARRVADRCRDIIVEEGKTICPVPKKGNNADALQATALMFFVAWMLIGWLYGAVKKAYDKDGKASPIYRLWRIAEATWGSADEKDCAERVAKLHKELGDE